LLKITWLEEGGAAGNPGYITTAYTKNQDATQPPPHINKQIMGANFMEHTGVAPRLTG
jgi:hypothetical protein